MGLGFDPTSEASALWEEGFTRGYAHRPGKGSGRPALHLGRVRGNDTHREPHTLGLEHLEMINEGNMVCDIHSP